MSALCGASLHSCTGYLPHPVVQCGRMRLMDCHTISNGNLASSMYDSRHFFDIADIFRQNRREQGAEQIFSSGCPDDITHPPLLSEIALRCGQDREDTQAIDQHIQHDEVASSGLSRCALHARLAWDL